MTLILGFAPFILFSILWRLSADLALWIAFSAAFVVTIRDFVERPVLRLLDGASLTLFGILAVLRGFITPDMTPSAVRTVLEAGLTVVIGLSLLRRRPFSLEYASGETHGRPWPAPAFFKVNYVISGAWFLAFLAMSLADAAVTLIAMPFYIGIAVSLVALGAAATLTLRYPSLAASKL
jgi:hypothetical protein